MGKSAQAGGELERGLPATECARGLGMAVMRVAGERSVKLGA